MEIAAVIAVCTEDLIIFADLLRYGPNGELSQKRIQTAVHWSIVDLSISKNFVLQKRKMKMKKSFHRLFWYIWIGIMEIKTAQYVQYLLMTVGIILRISNQSVIDIYLCENSQLSDFEESDIYTSLFKLRKYYS